MKSYELHANVGLDALVRVDRPEPPLGPRDVRVRIRAASLNYRDLLLAKGAAKGGPPIVPLSDGAGEVVEVGSSVRGVKSGDRVVGAFFPDWIDGDFRGEFHRRALGGSTDGMLAEQVVLEEQAWVRIPDGLSFSEASTLPCAAVTAYHALFALQPIGPGSTVLVQGTGGVSTFALQLAVAAGSRVVVTTSSASKAAAAKERGAWATVDYDTTPQWGAAVTELTEGRGVDLVVEVGGPKTLEQTLEALRTGGTAAMVGVLTGFSGTVSTATILHKLLRLRGVYVGSVRMFESLLDVLETHQIRPLIDRTFAFDEARDAYEYLASGKHQGKVVIEV